MRYRFKGDLRGERPKRPISDREGVWKRGFSRLSGGVSPPHY